MQVTHFQLDDYGPWTTEPEPRPEMDLQVLQSRLYADVADGVGARGGYAFYGRGDNVVAITCGLDAADHERLLETVANRYPVSASAGVGTGRTPAAALAEASERLQAAGSAQEAGRTRVLRGAFEDATEPFQVAHFDAVDATGRLTDRVDAATARSRLLRGFLALDEHLRERRGALCFFAGGDNAIAVCPPLERSAYEAATEAAEADAGVPFQVGVGAGTTAREAGGAAKRALERARRDGETVVAPDGLAESA